MVRQYSSHPQPPLYPPPTDPHAPSSDSPTRNTAGHREITMARPRQYALPLSRHHSYSQGTGLDQEREQVKPPEHMLRRKTPNGILAAAYDGTSVEETEKPHATKHILLPVTAESRSTSGFNNRLPLRSPGASNEISRAQPGPYSEWSPSLYFGTGSGHSHDAWKAGGQPLPQIDSMLNQIPPLQPYGHYALHGFPYCGVIGPSLQNFGPTVSNDQGPYGPYWYDGTFIPYQPAALRDPRYFHQGSGWSTPQHGGWPTFNNAMPNVINHQHNHFQPQQPQTSFNPIARPSLEYPLPYPQSHHRQLPTDFQNPAYELPGANHPTQNFAASSSGQSTPVAELTPVSTPSAEYGPQSSNGQMRERVFAWAHTVYIDLLKYLQSTRKPNPNNRHSNGQQVVRPHIYPKPPRQPSANFSSAGDINGSAQSSEQPNAFSSMPASQSQPQDPQPTYANQDPFHPKLNAGHHRSTSAWSLGTGNAWDLNANRPPWTPQMSQQVTKPHGLPMEPLRPLRRMSGTSIASVHQSFRPETPPSITAASALDSITKHCEESKWNWIDGILLGGCLAYALGDYQKAQEWYKHILTLDKE
jgi:hypothetical protein